MSQFYSKKKTSFHRHRKKSKKKTKRKKMGGGIMPIALRNGLLVVLLGKERQEQLWADFGGGGEGRESQFMTAIREGGEELNGCLGTGKGLITRVKKNQLAEIKNGEKFDNRYASYLFKIPYSDNLPEFFNNNDLFIRKKIPYEIERSRKTHNGLFEKDEIQWFTVGEIKRNLTKFRPHFVPIMEKVIAEEKSLIRGLRG